MQPHPAANLFPLITGEDFEALKADIRANGQLEPIWTYQGQILDGRNRYRACVDLGLEPLTREWSGEGSLVQFVLSLNLHRRHLSSSQRAVVALEVLPMLEEEAKARQVQSGIDFGRGGKVGQIFDQPIDRGPRASDVAAQLVGTNRQYVSDAKAIATKAPDLLEQVRNGDKTLVQAKRELKEQAREERRQDNAAKVATQSAPIVAQAKFATIVIDPPWDWGDEGDADQLGRARPDYATMSLEQLLALPVADLADVDCHLYLWITNRSLFKGAALMERWGFRYITAITWAKPSFGMGNYFRGQTEHILFGVKGSQPLKRKDVGTIFMADRGPGGHSSKPLAAYDLIESCSPGPYLEMFSRSNRPRWSTWGENGIQLQ